MNRYPLNSRTLGSGVTTPEKYWESTINVVVSSASATFVVLRAVFLESTVSITASTTITFKRFAAMLASMIAEVSTTNVTTRIQQFTSAIQDRVVSTFSASVGVLQHMSSNIVSGIETEIGFRVAQFMAGMQTILINTASALGVIVGFTASQQVRVDNTQATFDFFGEYAPVGRYIIVPEEDRDTDIVKCA